MGSFNSKSVNYEQEILKLTSIKENNSTINHDFSNKVIIVTGASDGIGKVIVKFLSKLKAKRIILPVRNRVKGEQVLQCIKESTTNNDDYSNIELWDVDLADLKSVKNFAEKFIKEVGELHLLINNAGLWNSKLAETKDNLEMQFQVNYLSHYLMTTMLLETMKKSCTKTSPAIIINVSSSAQKSGYFNLSDLKNFQNMDKIEDSMKNIVVLYSTSKLMQIMFSNELSRKYKDSNITSVSVHPGFINTNLGNHSLLLNAIWQFSKSLLSHSSECGAYNVLYPVLSAESIDDYNGKFFEHSKETSPNNLAFDQELCKQLWQFSKDLLDEKLKD